MKTETNGNIGRKCNGNGQKLRQCGGNERNSNGNECKCDENDQKYYEIRWKWIQNYERNGWKCAWKMMEMK